MPSVPRNQRKTWLPERKKYQLHSRQNQAFYNGATWRTHRASYLTRNPFCKECERNNIHFIPAVYVDHIHPINEGGEPYPPDEGLDGLCPSCDARKRQKESRKPKQFFK